MSTRDALAIAFEQADQANAFLRRFQWVIPEDKKFSKKYVHPLTQSNSQPSPEDVNNIVNALQVLSNLGVLKNNDFTKRNGTVYLKAEKAATLELTAKKLETKVDLAQDYSDVDKKPSCAVDSVSAQDEGVVEPSIDKTRQLL